jgi:hypothetical protein
MGTSAFMVDSAMYVAFCSSLVALSNVCVRVVIISSATSFITLLMYIAPNLGGGSSLGGLGKYFNVLTTPDRHSESDVEVPSDS